MINKKVTIKTVAEKAGVSVTTVSRVINNSSLVNSETKEKVENAIRDLIYEPNKLAQSLRLKRTRTIGVIVSNILNPFFTSVVRGMEDLANKSGYNIILCNTDEDPKKEIQYIKTLVSKQVDGLIIASTGANIDYEVLSMGVPIVFVDRKPGIRNKKDYDTVLVNNIDGARKATTHLIENKYKRIGIITGPEKSTTGHDRLIGYKQAISDAGFKLDESLIKVSDFLGNAGYDCTKDLLLSAQADAIFAANNMILRGVLKAINELSMTIPDEIGLMSFDDVFWMSYLVPQITAISQPTDEIGSKAMDLLLKRMRHEEFGAVEEIIDVKLIVRGSSVRP